MKKENIISMKAEVKLVYTEDLLQKGEVIIESKRKR